MISNLYLKNFKNITKKIKIKFAPITLIFGLNNVGKSSVIQSLDLISNLSNNYQLQLLTDYKNYGSIESIINKMWPSYPATIGLDLYQRNQKLNLSYSFFKNYSKVDYFDNYIDSNHNLIQTIEFNNNYQAYFKEINTAQKSYQQLVSMIYEVIRNPDNQFSFITNALDSLINHKKYQFILKEYERSYKEGPHGNIELSSFDLGDSNLWLKKIEEEFLELYEEELLSKKSENLAFLFSDLFSDFAMKSLNIKKYLGQLMKINNLSNKNFGDTVIYTAFQAYIERGVFESIFIKKYDDQGLGTLRPRVRQRLYRVRSLEIDNETELSSLLDNLKNISQFFKLAMERDTSKKRTRANNLIYKCIKGHKLNLIKTGLFDLSINLIKIIQDLKPNIFNDNDTGFQNLNTSSLGEHTLPYQLRFELSKFKRSMPGLNIFHNQFVSDRIFTYKNKNSYLDKLFENRNNNQFTNFISNNLSALGFENNTISIVSDENSFRVKIGNIDLADCGTGLKNILSIIVQLYDHTNLVDRINRPTYDQITCIEEPEANLHPKFQAELGDLIAKASKRQVQRRTQILIETHSQNLTLRFLKLVRKGQLDKEDIAFNCLYSDGGDISVFTPEILSNGSFVGNWPGGFFEESLSELYD